MASWIALTFIEEKNVWNQIYDNFICPFLKMILIYYYDKKKRPKSKVKQHFKSIFFKQ